MSILCADIGTSSLKTALVNLQGQVLSEARVLFPKTEFNQEGLCASEFGDNPCCLPKLFSGDHWFAALQEATHRLCLKKPEEPIEGICISGNGPTLATTAGEVFLWNHPVAPALSQVIQRELASRQLFSIFLPRLLAFKRLFPAEWNKSEKIISGPEYLIWRLTGRFLTILPEKRFEPAYWSQKALEKLGLESSKLPDFVTPATKAGTLLPEIAKTLGLSDTTPVFCGGPDFTVALIGTNTLEPGKLCDRAGSSEGINLCLASNPSQALHSSGIEGVRVLPSLVPGLFNASVLLPDSGTRFSKVKKATAPHLGYQDFVEALLRNPPLSEAGFHLMEALAVEVKTAYEKLSAIATMTGTKIDSTICTTGGQAKNPAWLRYKSQVVQAAFSITACADAELVGDAVLAYCGLGKFSSIQEGAQALVHQSQVFAPKESI